MCSHEQKKKERVIFYMTTVLLIVTICFARNILAKTSAGAKVAVSIAPNTVVEQAQKIESKLLKMALFAGSKNLADVREMYLKNNDYLEYPTKNRLYEAIVSEISVSMGRNDYPRNRVHQQLLEKFGPEGIPALTRCILAMDVFSVLSDKNGENLFYKADQGMQFYPLQKDILAVLHFLQIPFSTSVQGITEFSLHVDPLTENGDILFVGLKNDKKITFARISRQQTLDDWGIFHDALYFLCQQPLLVSRQPMRKMPGTKRVKQSGSFL